DAKQYDAAVKSLRQAKKLAPDNIDVLTALTRAEQANEKAQAEARRTADESDRQKNFQRLLDSGKANLANKQFDAAKLALTQALVLKPGDPDATTSLQAVDKALSTVKLDAGAKEAAEKKAAAYQKFMDEGRLALSTKRVDDAIRAFSAAQKLVPGDKASQGFLLDAQKAKQDADAAAALAAKKQAEEVKRAAALQKALTDGRAALAAKNLDAAAKAFNTAQTLAPGNPDVARALADLKQAQQAVQADAALQQKRLADFNQFVKQGQAALTAKRFAEAQQAYSAALKLFPSDAIAQRGLRDAERALNAAQNDQKRLSDYTQFIKQAQAAMQGKRYAEAQQAYSAALKLFPTDPTAQRGLQDATRALTPISPPKGDSPKIDPPKKDSGKIDPPKVDPLAQYQKAMQNGAAFDKQQKFLEAMRAYEEALKYRPKDQQATQGQRNAEFNYRLVEGQKHLQARRFQEAIREFEAALRISPNNPTATNLLNR